MNVMSVCTYVRMYNCSTYVQTISNYDITNTREMYFEDATYISVCTYVCLYICMYVVCMYIRRDVLSGRTYVCRKAFAPLEKLLP